MGPELLRRIADTRPIVPIVLAPVVGGIVGTEVARHHSPTKLGTTLMDHPLPTILTPMAAWGIGLGFVDAHRSRIAAYAVDGAEQITRTTRLYDGATIPMVVNFLGAAAIGIALGTQTRTEHDWQLEHAAR
jgi:hypothetical protein